MKRFEFLFFVGLLLTALQAVAQANQTARADSLQKFNAQDTIPEFLPTEAIIHARKGNKIYCFLPNDMKIQGVWCRGHKYDRETGSLQISQRFRD